MDDSKNNMRRNHISVNKNSLMMVIDLIMRQICDKIKMIAPDTNNNLSFFQTMGFGAKGSLASISNASKIEFVLKSSFIC